MKKYNLILAIAMASLLTVSASASDDDVIIKKARELQLSKKYDDAIKLYEANIQMGASERLYVDYATLLINLKKYSECDEILTKALNTYPDSLRIKNALGTAKYKSGNLSGASSMFSQVLSKDSENKYAKAMLDTIRKEKMDSDSPIAGLQDNGESNDDSDNNAIFSGKSSGKSSSGGQIFNVSNQLSLEQQQELAKKLYAQMIELDKWDTDTFISLHTQVIEKCPLTDQAQESCWRLSNLYLLGVEPADFENCIACLDHLLKQYPDTPLMPDAKNRLIMVCQQTENYSRVCELYEELFSKDPDPDTKTYMIRALDYANALAACGKTADAEIWYNKVLEKDNGKNALEARAARRKLSEL